jgi:oxygen-independent coproporphyrinogen-3 oxidase
VTFATEPVRNIGVEHAFQHVERSGRALSQAMTTDLFAKYDVPIPRYTSYPTVPQWRRTPTAAEWQDSLTRALDEPDASLGLYVHLPFCESLCTFCGCNTVITRDHGRARPYGERVIRELDRYLDRVPALADHPAGQMHLGGGTPTFAAPDVLAELIDGVFARIAREGRAFEGSVEADPRVTTSAHLDMLADRGFTRLSLGVQDFNAETQRLVNRLQSVETVARLLEYARHRGFTSVNFDLIYGLPGQTPASMRVLADQVLALGPDRLAVYSFARVPWIKPAQRKFTDEQVPAGADKRALYEAIRAPLLSAGYIELGLDHFARPDDGLARAAAAGTMHRNFQGYTERRATVLLGLGVSAISETPDCYHQNEKIITRYDRRIDLDEIPTLRGHLLSPAEARRRSQIVSLTTTFRADLTAEEVADARGYLAPLIADGLAVVTERDVTVPADGRPFLRNIAALFDDHLRTEQPTGPLYSRAV